MPRLDISLLELSTTVALSRLPAKLEKRTLLCLPLSAELTRLGTHTLRASSLAGPSHHIEEDHLCRASFSFNPEYRPWSSPLSSTSCFWHVFARFRSLELKVRVSCVQCNSACHHKPSCYDLDEDGLALRTKTSVKRPSWHNTVCLSKHASL